MTTSDATTGAAAVGGGEAVKGGTSSETAGEAGDRFSSLGEMKEEHRQLLKDARSKKIQRSSVLEFLRKGHGTGALLDAFDDRNVAQSLMDYWAASPYSPALRGSDAAEAVPAADDTVLAEFDSATVRDVAERAEAAVGALEPSEIEIARRVLLRLVRIVDSPSRFMTVSADRKALEDIDTPLRVDRVLQELLEAGALRVTAGDEREADLFHLRYESLIRQWGRLKSWLERRARFRDASRSGGTLIEDQQLDEARKYHDLDAVEQDFIAANDRTRARRMKVLKAFIVLLGLALLVVGFLAYKLWHEAKLVDASRTLAEAARDPDPEPDGSALEAAVKAITTAQTEEAERALHEALRSPVRIWEISISHDSGGFSLTPDGKRLATVKADGSVGIVDAASGELLQTLPASSPPQRIFEVALSNDHLATAAVIGEKKYIDIWTAPAGRRKSWASLRLAGLEDVSALAFSADGKHLAAAGGSPDLTIWDAESGHKKTSLSTHYAGSIQTFAFSADGQDLATSGDDGEVTLWNARTLTELWQLPRESGSPREPVTGLSFSVTGELATSTAGGAATWSVEQGHSKRRFPAKPSVGQEPAVLNVAFSPTGEYLATAGESGSVKIWAARTGAQISTIPTGRRKVERAVFTPPGDLLLATVSQQGRQVALWRLPVPIVALSEPGPPFLRFAFRADDSLLVESGTQGWEMLWNKEAPLPKAAEKLSWCSHFPRGAEMSFSSDGSRVACCGTGPDGEMLEVWSTDSKAPRLFFKQRVTSVGPVELSRDGTRLLALRTTRNEGDIWDVDARRRLSALPDMGGKILTAVALAPDGRSIAIVTSDGPVEVWALAPPRRRFTLPHGAVVFAVAFSPKAGRIATVGDDGLVKLWDADSGRRFLPETKMHHEDVSALAFSADGARLASGSAQGRAKLWDAGTGREILSVSGHGSRYTGFAFSRDRGLLAMAADDGSLQLEILDVDWLSRIASSRLGDLPKKRELRGSYQ
jgi:WD40 repeat protein